MPPSRLLFLTLLSFAFPGLAIAQTVTAPDPNARAPVYESATGLKTPNPNLVTAPTRVYSHPDSILVARFSPDGKTLAVGDSKGQIWLWPLGSEELVKTLEAHRKGVRTLAFSPDGLNLASGGGDGVVRIWDLKRLQPQAWLEARHKGAVTSLVYSPSGDVLFSGSADDSIWMRDVITGKKITSYFGHSSTVTGVVAAPTAPCVISGAEDRSLQSWSTRSGEQLDFSTQKYKVTALALSRDGRLLATATSDGSIALRRTDGCTVMTVALRLERHVGAVRTLEFSPDGRWLYSGGDDHLAIRWSVERGLPVEILVGHQAPVTSVTVSPDGQWLATAARDRMLRLWKLSAEPSP